MTSGSRYARIFGEKVVELHVSEENQVEQAGVALTECFKFTEGIVMEQQEINKIIALFHTGEPVSCKAEDTWTEDTDSRTIIYVEYPEGKFVIKAAANGFTTPERVTGWVEMIENYRKMGYYCPMLRKSRNGNYAEVLEVQGKIFHGRRDRGDDIVVSLHSYLLRCK